MPVAEINEEAPPIFKPTRKQMKAFMKQNGFNDEELFVQIN